jgi:hypothetical protein
MTEVTVSTGGGANSVTVKVIVDLIVLVDVSESQLRNSGEQTSCTARCARGRGDPYDRHGGNGDRIRQRGKCSLRGENGVCVICCIWLRLRDAEIRLPFSKGNLLSELTWQARYCCGERLVFANGFRYRFVCNRDGIGWNTGEFLGVSAKLRG